jgi:hypothetical protein
MTKTKWVWEPILPGNCRDQNVLRKFRRRVSYCVSSQRPSCYPHTNDLREEELASEEGQLFYPPEYQTPTKKRRTTASAHDLLGFIFLHSVVLANTMRIQPLVCIPDLILIGDHVFVFLFIDASPAVDAEGNFWHRDSSRVKGLMYTELIQRAQCDKQAA